MNNSMHCLTAAAFLAFSSGVGAGDLAGKITLKGTPRPEVVIDMSADPYCAQQHPNPATTRHYMVAPDGGLAEVFVYIKEGLSGKTFPAPTGTPELDQQDCYYKPYVIGVQVNQKFKIKNSDATLHNVHAVPKINKEFNFAQPLKGMVAERSFDKPEVLVRFKCDVHPWMFAYVGVVEHPFFAVTAKDGAYKITPLPAGKYTLAAVHPKLGALTQEITVSDSESKTVNFTFEVK